MMRTLVSVVLVVVSCPLMAQAPYLVKDINSTGPNQIVSSSPANFIRFGSRVLFTTLPPIGGVALWSTDGTANGTQHIVDIKGSYPSQFTPLNGTVLFNLTSDSSGEELWTTDGTASGTHLLADIATGTASSAPRDRIIFHDQMIFAADDKVHGNEVWITDATQSGTRLLKDLVPGASGSDPHSFVLFKDAVYFAVQGFLWKSDGTESGTVKVKSVWPDTLTATSFGLFFMGLTEAPSKEPWVSDGTEAGTHPIGAPTTRAIWSDVSYATAFRDRVLFVARNSEMSRVLWISDGSVAGTHIVRNLSPSPWPTDPNPFITVVGERAFFSGNITSNGVELWQTDGTEAGTTMVRDIVPGTGSSNPWGLVAVGDKVYFSALTSAGTGPTLWVTDGTSAGAHPVKGSNLTILGPYIHGSIANIDGTLYFSGSDGVNGQEPWKSDGSDAGTSMIANLYPESGPSGYPSNLVPAGDWVYFTASDGTPNASLWRSDGTSAGTLKLGVYPQSAYFAFGHSLLFDANGFYWTSNGTPEGTVHSDNLTKRFPGNSDLSLVLGDKIFASQYSLVGPSFATSAWWAATTASDAPAVYLGVNTPGCVANLTGHLIFLDPRLMTTDGTAKGTYEIVRLSDSPESCPAVFNGNVFFAARGGSPAVTKVWKTDGTFEGTIVATSFSSGSYADLTPAGRNLFIVIDGKLWVTDGIEPAAHALPATPVSALTPLNDRVVFRATDAANGAELWISDGTVPGTHVVEDLYPGPDGSNPTSVTNVGGLIYFRANDDLLGNELWATDGTAAGTRLVGDLEPGSDGSSPQDFVQAGNRLFFTATTKAFGRELWAMPLSTPSLAIDDIRVTEGDGADVIAHFTVALSPPASKNVTVDFATVSGTATAGVDYSSVSGTLTFTAGETTKSIDVHTHGNTIPENNKTILLTLGNPAGANLAKATAYALIEDDDQFADVAIALDFSHINANQVSANTSNNGPRAATGIFVATTATPSLTSYSACGPCTVQPLAPGTSVTAFTFDTLGSQRYLTAKASGIQRDMQPANNNAAWITNGSMAMDALYLTPGSQANVWFSVPAGATNIAVASSEPMIISVSPSIPTIGANRTASFLAQGMRIGKATLMVFTGTTIIGSLDVEVVAAGNTPRWPGGIKFYLNKASVAFDQTASFTIVADGTAPFSGTTATGLVTISSKGRELGRVTLSPTTRVVDAPVYPPSLGDNPITIDYAGDANFLPMTLTSSVTAMIGIPSITVTSTRMGAGVAIHIRATGSPFAAPTGTLDITAPGTQIHTQATLVTTAAGVAEADVTVVDPGETSHAVHVLYPGDAHYASATQDAHTVDLRRHAGGR